ncbi:MAG: DUF3772 domain-containing protein [Paracoccaceae bacterium]
MRFLARVFATAFVVIAIAVSSFAQESEGPDYDAWDTVAQRAEAAVEAGRASDQALDSLRKEIVGWRESFQEQLTANQSRLNTINEQIESLGPVPEEGEVEALEISERRAALSEQERRLSTPRLTAEEAFSRANGVISEIDLIIRSRQTDKLLNAGPWPINPVLWPDALDDLKDTFQATKAGVQSAMSTPSSLQTTRDNLPLIIGLTIAALILLGRSRKWVERLVNRVTRQDSQKATHVAGFFISLGMIIFPVIGAFALIFALQVSDLYGPRGEIIVDALFPMTLIIAFGRWYSSRIFPKSETVPSPIGLSPLGRREGRFYTNSAACLYAMFYLLEHLSTYENYSAETSAVLEFPLVVLSGVVLFAAGQLLLRHDADISSQPTEANFRHQFIRILGRAALIIGLIAPVLAAFGYAAAANTLIYPALMTLALIGTISLLQDIIRKIYAIFVPGDGGEDGLIPTLLSFLLLIGALPLFAIIWGARTTDLTELWAQARSGISIGGTTISPSAFFMLIFVFLVGYFLTRALQSTLRSTVLPKTRIDTGGQTAIISGLGYVGIFLSAIVAISAAGLDLSSLAIVAGALSVGIGFGLQTIVSNFVSGIILLIERPIAEGDWIEVSGVHGNVRKVSVRSTRIETFDRTDVIIPNSDLITGTVTNYTRGNTIGRLIVNVGVAYGTDTKRVAGILMEIAQAHPMVLANPQPSVVFASFGASSLDFEIRMILRDVNFMLSVKNDIHHSIAERFVNDGIEIPFAQTDLWIRNPETLRTPDSSGDT